MQLVKKIGLITTIVVLLAALGLLATGNAHIFKGLRHTYLIGKTKPDITDIDVFETRRIASGNGEPWPKSSRYGNQKPNGSELARLQELNSAAFVVVRQDSLLFEEYWKAFSETSLTNSFSMSKSFVSMLAGIAIGEEKIYSVFQPLQEHLPEFTEGAKRDLTLWHMLTMSSGLAWEEKTTPFSDLAKIGYGGDLRGIVMERDLIEEPGKAFKYGSGFTQIAGLFIQEAVGQTLSDYMSEKVWQRIGAENDSFWSLDDNEDERCFCCYYASARDYARIGKLYLDSGRWNGVQVVPEPWVLSSLVPAPLTDRGRPNARYGMSWWLLKHDGVDIFYARGLRGQYVICIPGKDLVIVRTGHDRDVVDDAGHPIDLYDWIDIGMRIAV